MSNFHNPDAQNWDRPPFIIDESPDDLDGAPAIAGPADAALPELADLQQTLAELQTAVQRMGRDLYKHTARMEPLFGQVARLRSDVGTLLERLSPEDKALATLKALLPLFDGLSNIAAAAQASAGQVSGGPEAEVLTHLNQAIAIVQEKGDKLLKDLGVVPIDSVGKPYDPNQQIVVDTTDNPDQPALWVMEEESKGYLYNEQVLRPAQVIVNKPKPSSPAATAGPFALPETQAEPAVPNPEPGAGPAGADTLDSLGGS